jgi:hypothetical protein
MFIYWAFANLVTAKAGAMYELLFNKPASEKYLYMFIYIGIVFKAIMPATATGDSHYCTCLGHFEHCNRDRIISIGQGKYIRCEISRNIVLNIASVNTA